MNEPQTNPTEALPSASGPDVTAQETQAFTPTPGGPATEPVGAPPTQSATVPTNLGQYEVRRLVGEGGMGRVYEAFDPVLRRVVALKVMSPALLGNTQARQRFLREASSAAQVMHENIVALHHVDPAECFLVMQFVAGHSLQEQLDQRGPLTADEVARIGKEVAAGLAAAHARGLVHRDIKPGNVLIEDETRRVKITDFGLARAVDDASLSHSGVIIGTPQYMAPEQAKGEELDHRADLFSLGSVLYALLAGRPPFVASNTMATLRKVCDEEPEPLSRLNPSVPRWLEAVVARLQAKDPAERYQKATDVIAALEKGPEGYVEEGITPAATQVIRPPVTLESAGPMPPIRKKRSGWAVALVVVGVLAGVSFLVCGGVVLLGLVGSVLLWEGRTVSNHDARAARMTPDEPGPTEKMQVVRQGEWKELFNGKDLTGWKTHPDMKGEWSVKDGKLTGKGQGGPLFTDRDDFGEFQLEADGVLNANGTCGVGFWAPFSLSRGSPEGKQLVLWHRDKGQVRALPDAPGTLGRFTPFGDHLIVPGQPFTLTLTATHDHVSGRLTCRGESHDFDIPEQTRSKGGRQGHIVLQTLHDGTEVQFSCIRVRAVPVDDPPNRVAPPPGPPEPPPPKK